ncbi:NAD(P)/FAD-dependent oxidoreductase [Tepidamorphus sp. 3E244]|uniref:NAD(P)/FAD-dependent oxidoreductase n=1 Tax=Tepidamorphus sp. 3E244 TaxID=3385498 RepID=UPI0038FBFE97
MADSILIVGAGQGGSQLAASLRQLGHTGEITLIGDEPGLPYQRPPLSKAYLKEGREDRLMLKPAAFYETEAIAVRTPHHVASVDAAEQTATLKDGETLAYDHLVLATGARNRKLPIEGIELDGVVELRTKADADAIRARIGDVRKAVVIGGGFIGLEFAAVATAMGVDVTVLEAASRVMSRVCSPPTSDYFHDFHAGTGTKIVFGATATRILGDDHVTGVETADGSTLDCDLVLVAAGVQPNVELAAEVGLDVDNGISVDAQLLTSNPAFSALGDCASFVHPLAGRRVRLESVQNAIDQAKCIAARLTGNPHDYADLPWFWSDQGDRKLQIAGLADKADDHVALPGEDGSLVVHCFENDRLVGVETVNAPAAHMMARKLLGSGTELSRSDLAAVEFNLRALRGR